MASENLFHKDNSLVVYLVIIPTAWIREYHEAELFFLLSVTEVVKLIMIVQIIAVR